MRLIGLNTRRVVALDAIAILALAVLVVLSASFGYRSKRAGDLPFVDVLKIYYVVLEDTRPWLRDDFVVLDHARLAPGWGAANRQLLVGTSDIYDRAIDALNVDDGVTWSIPGLASMGYSLAQRNWARSWFRDCSKPEDVLELTPVAYDARADVAVVGLTHYRCFEASTHPRTMNRVFLLEREANEWVVTHSKRSQG